MWLLATHLAGCWAAMSTLDTRASTTSPGFSTWVAVSAAGASAAAALLEGRRLTRSLAAPVALITRALTACAGSRAQHQ